MAQITGQISSKDFVIEGSPDNSVWTDWSGAVTLLTPGGGERRTGMKHTADGDFPLTTRGKREAETWHVEFAYSEGASDLYEIVRARFEATGGSDYYLRYAPRGGQSGEFRYTTALGHVQNLTRPPMNPESAAPV